MGAAVKESAKFKDSVYINGEKKLIVFMLERNVTVDDNALLADSNVTEIGPYAFARNTALHYADFMSVKHIGKLAFAASSLTHLILRSETMVTFDVEQIEGEIVDPFVATGFTEGYGRIYVPSALEDAYIADENWSKYADCFSKLENYTKDGTLTGAFDISRTMDS